MLDERIDEVARALTEGPPPDRLARRVLARIEEDERRAGRLGRFWIWSRRVAAPAMLILIIVGGVLWSSRREHQTAERPSWPASVDSRSGRGVRSPRHGPAVESPTVAHDTTPATPAYEWESRDSNASRQGASSRTSPEAPVRDADVGRRQAREAAAPGLPTLTTPLAGMDAIERLAVAPLALERIQVAAIERPDAIGQDAIRPKAIEVAPVAVPRLTMDDVP